MVSATTESQRTLETITGDLRAYAQLVPGTFLHADQLTTERRTNTELRNRWYYTADGPLYSLEGANQTPTLFLTRESDNLVLRHLNDKVNSSYEQLKDTKNYRPGAGEARQSMGAKDTLQIDLTKLRLRGDDTEWRYLEIDTQKYKKLKVEERKLAERYFGQDTSFTANMRMLKEAGIDATKIFVLNPEYVQREAQTGPVGRASWLYGFNYISILVAYGRGVSSGSRVRGVRREASVSEPVEGVRPQGAGAQKLSVPDCYQIILAQPDEALRAMNDHTAAGLSGLVSQYLATRKQ